MNTNFNNSFTSVCFLIAFLFTSNCVFAQWIKNDATNNISYSGGNVIIGTTPNSEYELAVAGKIITEKVTVQLQGLWPDYVFEDDYQLPSLKEIEKQIKEKGHLLHMPSSAEVEVDGIKPAEINKLLLEKIEELTLYVIELNNRIETLKKE